ncbi:inositol-tetrakisphosphate 1-kinase 6-like [Physcomitrium patens]|uniref:inositol-tetrakisphosphate 1-kinase 6-like n=1 Tax=Physcomitrium patens TaxID=3218 RepID=UPI003CCCE90A
MEAQLDVVVIILHKAADEIVSVSAIRTSNPADRIHFSDSIKSLQRYLAEHPEKCVVDPIDRLAPMQQ